MNSNYPFEKLYYTFEYKKIMSLKFKLALLVPRGIFNLHPRLQNVIIYLNSVLIILFHVYWLKQHQNGS
jgi:hypothetical protein